MSAKTVRAILEGRLATWATSQSYAVAWENAQAADQATFLRPYLLPAETLSEDLAGSHRAYSGVFQVSIYTPINAGPGAAYTIVDALNTQFPMNGRYSSGPVTVQIIRPASAGPAIQDEAHYIVPVSIGYRSDTI